MKKVKYSSTASMNQLVRWLENAPNCLAIENKQFSVDDGTNDTENANVPVVTDEGKKRIRQFLYMAYKAGQESKR